MLPVELNSQWANLRLPIYRAYTIINGIDNGIKMVAIILVVTVGYNFVVTLLLP